MKKIYYSFLIFCLILTIISCGKTTEESVSEAVSKTNNAVNDTSGAVNNTIFGENFGSSPDFHFDLEEGTSVWKFVTTDSGYALVGSKNRRPWIQIVDKNGNSKLSKRYDVFGEYNSNFGNGLPAVGELDGSAISQTNDGGYIVGTYVNPRHPSYGNTHIFKTNSQGEIKWKRELKYKSGKAKVIHFIEDIIQRNDGHPLFTTE